MRRSLGAVAVAAALLTLAGCSGSIGPAATPPTVTVTKTPTPKATPTSAAPKKTAQAHLTVGLGATCEMLFNSTDAPIPAAIKLMSGPTDDVKAILKAGDLASDLTELESTAYPPLLPDIRATVSTLAALGGVPGNTVDLQDFKAAGYDLLDRCGPYIG